MAAATLRVNCVELSGADSMRISGQTILGVTLTLVLAGCSAASTTSPPPPSVVPSPTSRIVSPTPTLPPASPNLDECQSVTPDSPLRLKSVSSVESDTDYTFTWRIAGQLSEADYAALDLELIAPSRADANAYYVPGITFEKGAKGEITVQNFAGPFADGESFHKVGTPRIKGQTVVAVIPKAEVPGLESSFEWRAELSDQNGTLSQCPADGAYALYAPRSG